VATWDTVRDLVAPLPEVEVSVEGRRTWSVRGKGFAWEARGRDGGGLGVRAVREEKPLLLAANPGVYFSSPHYTGYPAVQIRLELIDERELSERLEDAWLIQAPKRLAAEYVASSSSD
jgi:hypothetical protein